MRRAAKVDANHAEVVDALRAAGCGVLSLAAVGKGCPDLLVHPPTYPDCRMAVLMEIKDGAKPPSERKLTKAQVEFHRKWKGWIYTVTSVDEALDVMGLGVTIKPEVSV